MKKIFVVEDDNLLNEAYKEHFGGKYQMVIVENGQGAWEKIRESKPDVVLLDLYLPGEISGIDILQKLKEDRDTSDIKVIVMTNLPDQEKKVLEMGADKVFMKSSVELSDLESVVAEMVG